MEMHFGCTQCGKCCHDTKVPLTVSEAIKWLNRGGAVQLLCEASPWPEALNAEPRAAHFKRRSFAVMSGSAPAQVVVTLVANIVGACPNLRSDLRCGIYADRPLVCRIYPAEINPQVELTPRNKACPPEAWSEDQPVLLQGCVLKDATIQRDIEMSRSADVSEAQLKHRLFLALNFAHLAMVHEAVLVYSPAANVLLSALAVAAASGAVQAPAAPWQFVSDQPNTLRSLAASGAAALDLCATEGAAFQYFRFKREPIFAFDLE